MDITLEEIRKTVLAFRNARDWKQFHDPKNLAEAISIEAGELLQNFLWKTTLESKQPTEKELENIRQEMADIFIYILYLCEELDINVLQEVENKIRLNETKYPVSEAKGTSKKYTEL